MSERTYKVEEIRQALKDAHLTTQERAAVYRNLPPMDPPVPCYPGTKVYDCAGCVVGVVARASTFSAKRHAREIVVWEPNSNFNRVERYTYGSLFSREGERITGVAE